MYGLLFFLCMKDIFSSKMNDYRMTKGLRKNPSLSLSQQIIMRIEKRIIYQLTLEKNTSNFLCH